MHARPDPASIAPPRAPEPDGIASGAREPDRTEEPAAMGDDGGATVTNGQAASHAPPTARAGPARSLRYNVSDDELDGYAESQLELVLLVGLGGVLLGLAWSCLLFLLIGDPPARAVPVFRAIAISSVVLLPVLAGFAVIPFRQQRSLRRQWRRNVRRRRGHEPD